MSEDYWRLWILDAPLSRGMTTSNIANRKPASFSRRASSPERCKPCHVKREGRGGHGKRGVVPLFPYSLRPSRQSQETKKKIKEAERRQTLTNIRRILRCGARLARRARLSAFHRGSHLRELFHPKGSASGQASWGAV